MGTGSFQNKASNGARPLESRMYAEAVDLGWRLCSFDSDYETVTAIKRNRSIATRQVD
jgi:hypothetical protein